MILTLTCVLLNYTNIQMQSPLFSSESFPIDFTVISYTHFFHFFFFINFTFYTFVNLSVLKNCCFEIERSCYFNQYFRHGCVKDDFAVVGF